MKRQLWIGMLVIVSTQLLAPSPAEAQYAVGVLSYDAGADPAIEFGSGLPYDDASAAIGGPELFTGDGSFPSVVSPFSSPFELDEIVSIGEGGQITLRLSNFVVPQVGSPEVGVFTNASIRDDDYPNGQAESPPFLFGVDDAEVSVSQNGSAWVSLGVVTFDRPTNAYTDLTLPFSTTPGSSVADFGQPFTDPISSFDGLPYYDAGGSDILDLLAGSGGGTWLDISGSGLTGVGYIRFAVADDGDSGSKLNFELDAVSIATAAVGAPTVPEPSTLMLGATAATLLAARWKRKRPPILAA